MMMIVAGPFVRLNFSTPRRDGGKLFSERNAKLHTCGEDEARDEMNSPADDDNLGRER